ncbi:hypothetical protein [Aphanothece sacrum]|uniref:Uncharacterized protein n=1 Tax=Aphanothece sacrum FPU1 TaxID=1920663 RepID=A0A401IMM4_APHSA|nr:hypothetical protein [Aphanothece sacrum]GBF82493.1 hypothetical protein AsFPU1_3923 [Aphanothece sacrum FPU1]GBF85773.1 hypothetical protein AsFPU3_2838 [Aphanothece sacrum FPU3]
MNLTHNLANLTLATTLFFTVGSQLVFGSNLPLKNHQVSDNTSDTVSSESIDKNYLVSINPTAVNVSYSQEFTAIPQPLTIFFVLGMAGLSGVLKLKIAQAKSNQQLEDI